MKATDLAAQKEKSPESDKLMAVLDDYLNAFTGTPNGDCICCGKPQGATDILDEFLNAQFTWGLAHGEGFCRNCGYPARAIHYIGQKDEHGEYPLVLRNAILQYHPDGLSFDVPKEKEATV